MNIISENCFELEKSEMGGAIKHLYLIFKNRPSEIISVYGNQVGESLSLNQVFTIELRRIISAATIANYTYDVANIGGKINIGKEAPTLPWLLYVIVESENNVNYIHPNAIRSYYEWTSLSKWKTMSSNPDELLGCVRIDPSSDDNDHFFGSNGISLPEDQWHFGEVPIPDNDSSIVKQYARQFGEEIDSIIELNSSMSTSLIGFTKLESLRPAMDKEYGRVYELGDSYIRRLSQLEDPKNIEDLAFDK